MQLRLDDILFTMPAPQLDSTIKLNFWAFSCQIQIKALTLHSKQQGFMAAKEEVELFLSIFIQKVKVLGIVFRDDRGKNMQTLLELEITPKYREDVIMNLDIEDYVEGPIEDTLNKKGEMWVFGKELSGRDVYIKISMGISNSSAICTSFNIAEHRITYKFK